MITNAQAATLIKKAQRLTFGPSTRAAAAHQVSQVAKTTAAAPREIDVRKRAERQRLDVATLALRLVYTR